MVTCTHCGSDNQPNAVYCNNCGVPVHKAQYQRREFNSGSSVALAVGMMVVGVMLMGLGLVVGLFGGQMGMRTDDIIGYVIFVFGVIVFSLSFLLFRRLR
ncbi:MAG: zinc ribbon domain-containing protein [Methanomassiliicoccales archaeon]|nr:zinc ribbon domain-containing protein [Methanomassiliicoccales archaeon]